MMKEAMDSLNLFPGGTWVDCTVGDGGHSKQILEDTAPDGFLIGFDRDGNALDIAEQRLKNYRGRFKLIQDSYANINRQVSEMSTGKIDGILFDLGFSSRQIEGLGYGLSFMNTEKLDMRFDQSKGVSALDIVNEYAVDELTRVIKDYGEERAAKRIAQEIINARPLYTTKDLADVVKKCVYPKGLSRHPATKTFQALRIEVNDELGNLEDGLQKCVFLMRPRARISLITYHSLEDKIVKSFFKNRAEFCHCPKQLPICVCEDNTDLKIINKKVIKPGKEEIMMNRRSRSAKMRIAEKKNPNQEGGYSER